MKNFNEFTNEVIKELSARLNDVAIEMHVIDKNNGVKLHGLTFKGAYNISPTIYIDQFYEQYTKYRPLIHIVEEIKETYLSNACKENIDISFFTDFEKAKSKIVFSLVSYKENEELLKKIPHVKYLDFAIIFRCVASCMEDGYATVLIYHHHLNFWKIGMEELYQLAMENTPKLLEYRLENMAQMLWDLFTDDETFADDIEIPMYVLSNSQRLNGAGCILYKGLLEKIADRYQTDFYIIPSSVHEVILIPVNNSSGYSELSKMVKEVNSTQLSREEILSDHVYYYSREKGTITM